MCWVNPTLFFMHIYKKRENVSLWKPWKQPYFARRNKWINIHENDYQYKILICLNCFNKINNLLTISMVTCQDLGKKTPKKFFIYYWCGLDPRVYTNIVRSMNKGGVDMRKQKSNLNVAVRKTYDSKRSQRLTS